MRVLVDTHIAVWAAFDPSRLSASERRSLEEPGVRPVLSVVALWELRLKWHSFDEGGRRKGPADPAGVLVFAERSGWGILLLTAAHATATLRHPLIHKDPFDELLMVQAQEEEMPLLTRDRKLLAHPLAISGSAPA